VDTRANCAVEFDALELIKFIARDLPVMNQMCERAGARNRRSTLGWKDAKSATYDGGSLGKLGALN
jgi:hypothetical protein